MNRPALYVGQALSVVAPPVARVPDEVDEETPAYRALRRTTFAISLLASMAIGGVLWIFFFVATGLVKP